MLKFSDANTKLKALYDVPELQEWLKQNPTLSTYGKKGRKVYSLDLLSGWSCPFAKDCLSKVHETGEFSKAGNPKVVLKDGPETEFRCFSASQEALLPNVYKKRKHNYDSLRGLHLNDMIHRLNTDLPEDTGILRWHVGGDFFNSDYFFAAINVAMMNPDKLFYAYTKSIRYWIDLQEEWPILDNFVLTASYGGRDDSLIEDYNLRTSKVVYSEQEAHDLELAIDHDDSHAARPSLRNESFALMLHGTQPKGSTAADALKVLKRNNVRHSYNRKKATV
jgi:hypothetical protein